MNYALAKQLKDVGYKQEGLWGICFLPEKESHSNSGVRYVRRMHYRTFPWKSHKSFTYGGYEPIVLPTLSELILACGDRFERLERINEKLSPGFKNGDKWQAMGYREIEYADSPEEAVAKLWLALNPHTSEQEIP